MNSVVSYININELKIRRSCLWYWSSLVHTLRVVLSGTYIIYYLERKVLHIDRNGFYGGEGASVNLTNLWKLFKGEESPPK